MHYLMKYPSRARPELFLERLESYLSTIIRDPHDHADQFTWVFSFDEDDDTMNTVSMREKIHELMKKYRQTDYSVNIITGKSNKIIACNAHVNEKLRPEHDIVMLISDDMVPVVTGWHEIISKQMLEHFPQMDGAIHLNDGLQGSRLCTISIMGAKLYRHFGYFYHPDYESCFCDNEYTEIIWSSRRAVWWPNVIIRHDWVGNTLNDELHQKNHVLMNKDQHVFMTRRAKGFPRK